MITTCRGWDWPSGDTASASGALDLAPPTMVRSARTKEASNA
jgi:hypothetical protein